MVMHTPLWTIYGRNTLEHLGVIPLFLDSTLEMPAAKQIDANYQHGGGWRPMGKFTFRGPPYVLSYPGDPPYRPVGSIYMPRTKELVVLFEYAWLVVKDVQSGKYEVSRVD